MSKKLLSLLFAACVLITFSACDKEEPIPEPKPTPEPTPAEVTYKNYICNTWTEVDLSSLGEVGQILVSFESSDNGEYGMNTPAYVCLDNFKFGTTIIGFESEAGLPTLTDGVWDGSDETGGFDIAINSSVTATFTNAWNTAYGGYSDGGFNLSTLTDKETAGVANQYSVYSTGGANGSATFAVLYYSAVAADNASLAFTAPITINSVMVNNSTYAYLSMTNGDSYAKKFDKGDWFKVIFTGYNGFVGDPNVPVGTVEYYLADFRANE